MGKSLTAPESTAANGGQSHAAGRGLSPKQLRFIEEYPKDLNGTEAAKRAGYAAAGAAVRAHRLLANPSIRSAIAAKSKVASNEAHLELVEVLRVLKRILHADPRQAFDENSRLRPVRDIPEDVALTIAGIDNEELWGPDEEGNRVPIGTVRKLKFWSKDKALELALRHLGALHDKVDHKHAADGSFAALIAASLGGG